MQERHGNDKAVALRRFEGLVTFDKPTATDMLKVLFPNAEKASPAEFAKALGLCVDYGADPRLGEVFMVPFKKPIKDDRGNVIRYEVAYETIRGIRFTRKVANQRHKFTYVDMTPRLMTEAEEITVYRTLDPNKIRAITHVKDLETGKEAWGYGEWSKTLIDRKGKPYNNVPKGTDKGNSMEDMAMKRSEAHGLDRLYATERYTNVRVADDSAIDAQYRDVTNERTIVEPAALPLDELVDSGDGDGEPPAAAASDAAPITDSAVVDPPAQAAASAAAAPPPAAPAPDALPAAMVSEDDLARALMESPPDDSPAAHRQRAISYISILAGSKGKSGVEIAAVIRGAHRDLAGLPKNIVLKSVRDEYMKAIADALQKAVEQSPNVVRQTVA